MTDFERVTAILEADDVTTFTRHDGQTNQIWIALTACQVIQLTISSEDRTLLMSVCLTRFSNLIRNGKVRQTILESLLRLNAAMRLGRYCMRDENVLLQVQLQFGTDQEDFEKLFRTGLEFLALNADMSDEVFVELLRRTCGVEISESERDHSDDEDMFEKIIRRARPSNN